MNWLSLCRGTMPLGVRWQLGVVGCSLAVSLVAAPTEPAKPAPKDPVAFQLDAKPIAAETKARSSYAPVLKNVAPAVVNIFTARVVSGNSPLMDDPFYRRFFGDQAGRQQQRQNSLGSGVIISRDGYVLTNNHVVAKADEIKVALADRSKQYDAKLIGADPKSDVAVLKLTGDEPFPCLTVTDSDQVEVGDTVFAIGNPFGIGQTITRGIVSAVGRANLGITEYEDWIQTDASINPGNSGGALIDAEGRLIGINSAIMSRTGTSMGVGFAVPVNFAREILDQIITHGRVIRSYLGITIQPVQEKHQALLKLTDLRGALISAVATGGPAAEAQLERGDVVVEFDGTQVRDVRHLRFLVARSAPGTAATLKVMRDGQVREVKATLREQPGADTGGGADDAGGDDATPPPIFRGLKLTELSDEMRRELKAPGDLNGLIVVAVDGDTPAAAAGLKPKDVIFELNRRAVKTSRELYEAARAAEGSALLLYVWAGGNKRYVPLRDRR